MPHQDPTNDKSLGHFFFLNLRVFRIFFALFCETLAGPELSVDQANLKPIETHRRLTCLCLLSPGIIGVPSTACSPSSPC